MPRPKSTTPTRTARVHLRVHHATLELWTALAKDAGLSLNAWVESMMPKPCDVTKTDVK